MFDTVIKVEDLVAGYNNKPVIKDISFSVKSGEIIAIIGPNGAGKSTLLKAILGIARIFSGAIKVLNYSVKSDLKMIKRLVGYVPQREYVSFNVPLRVRDIVLSGILLKRGPLSIPTKGDMLKVRRILESVNLPRDLWLKKFSELSGGQQQKTLLARALVSEPKILLLDEPFSAVDIPSQREIMHFLRNMVDNNKLCVLIVLHDINEVTDYIDKVILLNKTVIAWGKPEEVLTRENLKIAYGVDIEIIVHKGKCLALIGDKHA
ncbi:MAG: metal ABC transporter ATP-binding protein [Crenarchaeota archaeon]|nr:metal ABC transporter ATP-binding protein [Thermoproteota archaeon]MCR8454111.1 metal ABC transporter ATP-binding protein [Thermoproteota archaeon]MCR8455401.1 metal ABC transporter ATP-binding protein [Thermoproteota archaeon]MCR8463275.1 metal ABC transporter ATP-binding protein [Thermoproteota archaeon]MCR8471242.1 metal ABC transporter ATP-binding protein [Thermoproteota archaeon]